MRRRYFKHDDYRKAKESATKDVSELISALTEPERITRSNDPGLKERLGELRPMREAIQKSRQFLEEGKCGEARRVQEAVWPPRVKTAMEGKPLSFCCGKTDENAQLLCAPKDRRRTRKEKGANLAIKSGTHERN